MNKEKLYEDLMNAGENVILDFGIGSRELNELLERLEKDTKGGIIDEFCLF